jgi:hypothetical protein
MCVVDSGSMRNLSNININGEIKMEFRWLGVVDKREISAFIALAMGSCE